MTLLGEALKRGAALYFTKGYTAIPLILDSNGFPKRPFSNDWQKTPHDASIISSLPWSNAFGLGLVLGQASDNLAVLDIDDVEMGALALEWCGNTRRIRTIRKRAHIYVRENQPSPSSRMTVQWRGREVTVELKSTGTQVAAPPTPGYEQACEPDLPPIDVPSVAAAWNALAIRLGISTGSAASNYPQPWQQEVKEGNRNNSAYVESHRLREAGMPYDQALELMRLRWESSYQQGGMPWREVERTVRSAYSRGIITQSEVRDELAGIA